jgi:hypothetical protein
VTKEGTKQIDHNAMIGLARPARGHNKER